jgi:hypothetical protein
MRPGGTRRLACRFVSFEMPRRSAARSTISPAAISGGGSFSGAQVERYGKWASVAKTSSSISKAGAPGNYCRRRAQSAFGLQTGTRLALRFEAGSPASPW